MPVAIERFAIESRLRRLSGILCVGVGLVILLWPMKTAITLTLLVALYAVVMGIVYVVPGIVPNKKVSRTRVDQSVLGVVFIIAALIALVYLSGTTGTLTFALGLIGGTVWIVEGVVLLSSLRDTSGWAVAYPALCILAGALMLLSPIWDVAFLSTLFGTALLMLGLLQILHTTASNQRGSRARVRRSAFV